MARLRPITEVALQKAVSPLDMAPNLSSVFFGDVLLYLTLHAARAGA